MWQKFELEPGLDEDGKVKKRFVYFNTDNISYFRPVEIDTYVEEEHGAPKETAVPGSEVIVDGKVLRVLIDPDLLMEMLMGKPRNLAVAKGGGL